MIGRKEKGLSLLTTWRTFITALATGGIFLLTAPAAGSFSAPAATLAAVHVFAPESRGDHGPCTSHPATDLDRLYRAVQGACPALHAGTGPDQFRTFSPLGKDPVGADLGAPPAVDASFGIIFERGLGVGIKHQITPRILPAPRIIPKHTPVPAMIAIVFTYRNISFFTPVREVKGVDPVKLRAR
jgi:hypothetical protein